MNNVVEVDPKEILIHGPSKLLVDRYLWHEPQAGIVGSYRVAAHDVLDHFGLFRGVDQIESFGQTLGSTSVFLECVKQNCSFADFKKRFTPTFISVGQVHFHNYLEEGDTLINVCRIEFYKFRQMVGSGRVYKAPRGMNLAEYFKDFSEARLRQYDLDKSFILVAEIGDITGRTIKNELLRQKTYDKTGSN